MSTGSVLENRPAAAPSGMPVARALAYVTASIVLALTQGLGQGFVSSNIPQIAGDLGITATQATWLTVAYMIPRATLPVMLIKIRTQYGLRRFAEMSIIVYLLVSFSALWISDLRSAVVVQALSGIAAAPLSSLAFLYMLESLSPAWQMRFGLPTVMAAISIGPVLARVISPALIGDGGLIWMHLLGLGLAMISLALVFHLPLKPVPHQKVIEPLDFLSFFLVTLGFGGIVISFVMGPIHWWRAVPWIGWLQVASCAALTALVVTELNRKTPLFDIRWIASPAIVHLSITLLVVRLILSEQSTGAPKMFQVLGLAPSQLTTMFTVICLASVIGALACIGWMNPERVPQFHLIALLLIAAGTWMDSHGTVDTRPTQMIVSQALIGFAAMLFIPPAMMAGLGAAMRKGPNYLLSFVIIFLSTQSLGGIIGSGTFSTLINWRQASHSQALIEQVQATDINTATAIANRMAALAPQVPDTAAQRMLAVEQIAREVTNQAYVLAYNDVYFLIFLIAAAAAVMLLLHMFRDWLDARASPRITNLPAEPVK